jgi:hypothetical protein
VIPSQPVRRQLRHSVDRFQSRDTALSKPHQL